MKFRVGMRTLKTGLSVFICVLFTFLFQRDTYVVSTITAVFTLREDMERTMKFGKHRVAGNIFGAFFSVVIIFVFNTFGRGELVQIITLPVIIMVMITLLSGCGYPEGIVGACATLLTIVFMVPEQDSYIYAFNRVIDSFIGMGVAFGINALIPVRLVKKRKNKKTEIEEK